MTWSDQKDGSRAKQRASGAKDRIGCGWDSEYRAQAPDESARARVCRREKQFFRDIANAVRVAVKYCVGLADDRDDRACDQIPIGIDVQRDNRLDVQDLLSAVERPLLETG